MCQGQPRVIIWTTLIVLPYTMLHTKFQGHWSIGSGEEDFLRFLPYMGMAAMLVMWSRSFEQLFFPKGPGGCIWNLVAIRPVVLEEKSFEIVDGRRTDDGRTDGRTTDNGACLYYKLPWSLRLRWANKRKNSNLQQNLEVFSAATDSEIIIIQILHGMEQIKNLTELSSLGQEPTFKILEDS